LDINGGSWCDPTQKRWNKIDELLRADWSKRKTQKAGMNYEHKTLVECVVCMCQQIQTPTTDCTCGYQVWKTEQIDSFKESMGDFTLTKLDVLIMLLMVFNDNPQLQKDE